MSESILVVGATGYAGRHLVAALSHAGHRVRAIVRSRERAEAPGPFDAPALTGLVAEWVERPITASGAADGVCEGIDRVVSALGVTRQRADPWDVDFLANLRVLGDAERSGARSFLYVNVMHVWSGRSMILRSKAAFTAALTRSSLAHQLVNPSGYFSDVGGFLDMARAGVVVLPPDPDIGIAPIHGADLADFCVRQLSAANGSWDVGGPDVFTYREIAQIAREVVGRRAATVTLPAPALHAAVRIADHLGQRPRTLAQFFADGLTQSATGERYGTRHLRDYFQAVGRPSKASAAADAG